MKWLFVILVCAIAPISAFAEDLPPVVRAGFDAYSAKGAEAAWAAWGLEGGQKAIGQASQWTSDDKTKFAAALSDAAKNYGRPMGYELIRTFEITPSYRTIHVLWRFERKPLFCMFVCYRGDGDWRVLNFFFGSDPREFLPESITGMPPARQ
ncbi:MAG: hypothetical protein QOC70_2912 [Verrucomicrobiota bacterium]|jgi:hypothetical protein